MTEAPRASEGHPRELISFRLGAQEFCVDIMAVREIRGWTDATPLPNSPDYVRGMINLRGTVLPIIDLRGRFGLPPGDSASRRVIVVVWIGTKLIGLLVDAVCDILSVPQDAIHPAPELADDAIRNFVSAILTVDTRMVCLIALDRLLPQLESVAA